MLQTQHVLEEISFGKARVLITGASGFIGWHVSKALAEEGFDVYASEHLNKNPSWVHSISCDLRIPSDVINLVAISQPDVVVHLASQPIVQTGEDFVRYTFECNVLGTLNLYDALMSMEVFPVVVASSSDKVYGRSSQLPYTEDMPLLGNEQAYETSKTMQDHMMQYYSCYFPTIITRCSNVYGPGDTHSSRIVPHVIQSYVEGDAPTIRSSGQYYRDYLYITDVVDAYMRCVQRALSMPSGLEIYNFGTSIPVRVLDLVSLVRDFFIETKDPDVMNMCKDEIHKQYNSYERANQVLGWKPSVKLRDGIEQTIKWWRER